MTDPADPLDAENRATYASAESVAWYAGQTGLKPPEADLLASLGTEVSEGRVLDLGIGGGRTTGPLAALAGSYVGIDYVPGLVAAAQANHPGVAIEVGDARHLRFADDSFDVAFFSFNGIDGVTHEDRLAILAEVRRVLRPGGAFLFSAHNRDWTRFAKLPWQGRSLISRPTLRASATALLATPTRRRLRRQEVHRPSYAIVNDQAHRWSLLLYYVREADQVAQLEAAGYSEVLVRDMHGRPTTGDGAPDSVWLYYLARA